MKEIKLTQGKVALVDDEDYEYLSQWKWYFHKGYAVRNRSKLIGGGTLQMHRVIMRTPVDMATDHINHNGLDNRKSNLRICTNAQNNSNTLKHQNNTSGYKGVTFDAERKKWRAQIRINNVTINLGRYSSILDAVSAHDKVEKENRGEFANLNNL